MLFHTPLPPIKKGKGTLPLVNPSFSPLHRKRRPQVWYSVYEVRYNVRDVPWEYTRSNISNPHQTATPPSRTSSRSNGRRSPCGYSYPSAYYARYPHCCTRNCGRCGWTSSSLRLSRLDWRPYR